MAIFKRIIFSIFFVSGCLFWIFWIFSQKSYFVILPITYDHCNHPRIEIKVGNSSTSAEIRVGSRFPLFLDKELLSNIDKQLLGTEEWHDLQGNHHKDHSYLIPTIQIGNLSIKNITAIETHSEENVAIGMGLGKEYNLFLDFPHSKVIACDSFAQIKKKGLADNNWIQIPFDLNRAGAVFLFETDLGSKKLALATTIHQNILRPSLTERKSSYCFSTFSIKEVNFGTATFQAFDLPDQLCEIDGFIGMDFLREHAIYLDFANKQAYIEPPQDYFEHFPVFFDESNTPHLTVCIEDSTYSFVMDLGLSFSFSLHQDLLKTIQKSSSGTTDWSDFRGKKYEAPKYRIPKINIGNLSFIDTLVVQERKDFYESTALYGAPHYPIGAVGASILEKYNLFLDFPHNNVYASKTLSQLQAKGLFSNYFLQLSFYIDDGNIILPIALGNTVRRLILDTGATYTVMRKELQEEISDFCIAGHSFGKRSILFIDIHPRLNFDGCLGMDFLCEYPLFIDYCNKFIFIDLAKSQIPAFGEK